MFQLLVRADVVLHRVRLRYEALAEGLTGRQVLQEILSSML